MATRVAAEEDQTWRDQLAEIVGALPAGVVINNSEGIIAYANAEAARILGAPPVALIGRKHADHNWKVTKLDGTPLPAHEGTAARVLHTGKPVCEEELAITRPDGTSVIVAVNSSPFGPAGGQISAVITSIVDITARKEAEREQAKLRFLLRAIIKNMPVGIMVAEAPVGKLIMSNDKIEELWREPVIGPTGETLPHRCQFFRPSGEEYVLGTCPLSRALLHGETVTGEEMRFRCWDGTRAAADVNSTPIRDEVGEMIAAVAFFNEKTIDQTQV